MTRFRITGIIREEGISPGAWDWPRVRDRLVHRCGEMALGWTLTARRMQRVGGGAVVIIRVAPDEPNMEAWGELYTCAEPLAQALSEVLETEVVVVSSALDDPNGALARYDRGRLVEVEARVGEPVFLAARVMGVDPDSLRALVASTGQDAFETADTDPTDDESEVDGEEFAEQTWLEQKRQEARAWMARYRKLKSARQGGSENPQL